MNVDPPQTLAALDLELEALRKAAAGKTEPARAEHDLLSRAMELLERLHTVCHQQKQDNEKLRTELGAHMEEVQVQDEELTSNLEQRQILDQYLDAVFRQAPMGYVVLDKDLRIKDCNTLAEEYLTPKGVALRGTELRSWCSTHSWREFEGVCYRALRLQERKEFVLEPRAREGGLWLHAVVAPLKLGNEQESMLLCSLLDITRQRQTHQSLLETKRQLESEIREREVIQQHLERQESRFRRIIAENVDALLVVGEDGFVLFANPAADELLARGEGELQGTLLGFSLQPSEIILEQPGNMPARWAELRYSEIEWEGQPARLVSLRDTTLRKMAERELLYSHSELEKRVEQRTRELEQSYVTLHGEMFERMRASDLLRRIQKAVDSSGDAIIIAETLTRADYCNPAVEHIFGYTRESLNQAGGLSAIYKDEDTPDALQEVLAQGQVFDGETLCVTPYGHEVPVLLRADAVLNEAGECVALVAVHKDISEIRHAQEAMEASREEFRNLADNLPEMVARIDTDLCYAFANRALTSAWGVAGEEVYGTCLRDLDLPQDLYDLWLRSLEEVLQKGVVREFDFSFTRDGLTHYYHTRIAPEFDKQGRTISCVSLTSNVTSRVEMERELRQSQKMEALGAMAGKVAHDFNNMLGVIMTSAELLRMRLADPPHEVSRRLERIGEAANQAKGIIERMLGFARMDTPKKTDLDLESEVRTALAMLHDGLPPSISLNYSSESGSLSALADSTLLQQIILNLGLNARDAIGEDTGRIDVFLDSLLLSESETSQQFPELQPGWYARLAISDNGPGIDPEHLEHIFEPFFTTKGKGKGTGLGLSMVHRILRQHEGAVRVESMQGEGTSFYIFLPLNGKSVQPPAEEVQLPDKIKATVLLVDDEPAFLESLQETLGGAGCQVIAASNAIAALQRLDELLDQGTGLDLLFTDQSMPGMNGIQLIENVRKTLPQLPVVLCTGFSDSLTTERSQALQAVFLPKPFSSTQLLQSVARALNL